MTVPYSCHEYNLLFPGATDLELKLEHKHDDITVPDFFHELLSILRPPFLLFKF